MVSFTVALVLAAVSGFCYGLASAEDDLPMTHLIMLQFTLDGDDPYEFAGYAPEFAESLERILSKGYEFDNVNAVVLGVGKTDCGISVITVIEYTKNRTSDNNMNIEDIIQYIVDTIENNRNIFEDIYNVKSIKSVDVDSEEVKYMNKNNNSVGLMVGAMVGALCLVGVAASVAVGVVVYIVKTRKAYEKLPLLIDESISSERKWLKLPGGKKPGADSEKF